MCEWSEKLLPLALRPPEMEVVDVLLWAASLWVVVGRPFPAAAAQEVLVCGGPEDTAAGGMGAWFGTATGATGFATGTEETASSEMEIKTWK